MIVCLLTICLLSHDEFRHLARAGEHERWFSTSDVMVHSDVIMMAGEPEKLSRTRGWPPCWSTGPDPGTGALIGVSMRGLSIGQVWSRLGVCSFHERTTLWSAPSVVLDTS